MDEPQDRDPAPAAPLAQTHLPPLENSVTFEAAPELPAWAGLVSTLPQPVSAFLPAPTVAAPSNPPVEPPAAAAQPAQDGDPWDGVTLPGTAALEPPQPAPSRWVLPTPNPDRATRRRVLKGTFGGILLPGMVAACLAPAAVAWALLWGWTGQEESALGSGALGSPAAEMESRAEVLHNAVKEAREELGALTQPAWRMARLEAKRSAHRGAALVEQELRRLKEEAVHHQALEAALTRQPRLQGKDNAGPGLAPAALDGFVGGMGLTSPGDAQEGEVVVDESGQGLGAPVPESFKEFTATAETATQSESRVAHRVAVKGMPLWVLAVRRLPLMETPQSLKHVEGAVTALVQGADAAGQNGKTNQERLDAARTRLDAAAWLSLLVGALAAAWVMRAHGRWVRAPLLDLRAQVECVRSGGTPAPPEKGEPLEEVLTALGEIAQRLGAHRAQAAVAQERMTLLDSIITACERAQLGDCTARPNVGDQAGGEAMAALAVGHLLEHVEARAMRVKTQARALVEALAACEQLGAPSKTAPALRIPLDTLHKRLESLTPLSGLLRNLAARLQSLSTQDNLPLVHEDLQRLAGAVAPRSHAVAALLTDLQDNARKLEEALSGGEGTAMSGALSRAKQAAADLAKDSRVPTTGDTFPGLLAAMRGVPPPELEHALRLGMAQSQDSPS